MSPMNLPPEYVCRQHHERALRQSRFAHLDVGRPTRPTRSTRTKGRG